MIYLHRYPDDSGPPAIAAVEDPRRAPAYARQGYRQCDLAVFVDDWRERDDARYAELRRDALPPRLVARAVGGIGLPKPPTGFQKFWA